MERNSLIVVEYATDSRAIVEHHGASLIRLQRTRIRGPHDQRHGCFRIVFR